MKRNKKHNNKDLENFLDYSGGQMTGKERNIFEKNLQKDPFESDAAEGLSTLSRKEAMQDMKDLSNRLSARTGHSNRFIFYRAAAAVAAILVGGTIIILLTSDLNQVFERVAVTENNQPDSEVPAMNIPSASKDKTVTSSELKDAVLIAESAEENKKQTIGGIDEMIETKEDTHIVTDYMRSENIEEK